MKVRLLEEKSIDHFDLTLVYMEPIPELLEKALPLSKKPQSVAPKEFLNLDVVQFAGAAYNNNYQVNRILIRNSRFLTNYGKSSFTFSHLNTR
jgi:hypothetical protein